MATNSMGMAANSMGMAGGMGPTIMAMMMKQQ